MPKHPLFLFEGYIKRNFPSWYPTIFDDQADLKAFKDDRELELEDDDAKEERQMIYNMDKSEYSDYPLVAKDIRKVYPSV